MKLPLRQLAYRSRACVSENSTHCLDILRAALRRNEALGVTGCLHLQNGMFLQLIEGPTPAIETLIQHIRRDSRHIDLQVLLDRPAAYRLFPDWHMCLASNLTRADGTDMGDLPDPETLTSEAQVLGFFTNVYALKTGAQPRNRQESPVDALRY